jgi:CheY-like chemotaxis protein
VILADLRLREGRTGVQAIQAIFEHCGHAVPAAIFTGDTDPSRLVEAKASGFPLVYKPLSAVKLRTLIANLLRP